MNLVQSRLPDDIVLEPETEIISHVICKRCGNQIGRLQIVPAERNADEEEIYAEIRLITEEHRSICGEDEDEDSQS